MVSIIGKYQHYKNENMDAFFASVGVPYIPRKLMSFSSPSLEISQSDGEWCIVIASALRTTTTKFKIGEEYEETMPNGEVLKNIPTLEGNKIEVDSTVTSSQAKSKRIYEFDEEGCIVTHVSGDVVGKRYFKRQ